MPKRIHKIVDMKWETAVPISLSLSPYLSLFLLGEVDRFQKSGYIYERISNNKFCQIKIQIGKYAIGLNVSEEPQI
jgi:hypothetical protein